MRRMFLIFFIFCLTTPVYAEIINKKYSFRDFTGKSLKNMPVEEFNDTIIVGSCFYQVNKPNADIFPDGMKGVHFKRCNLDNVLIPVGNTIEITGWEACTNKKIQIQNDWEDWILDDTLKPVEPMEKEEFLKRGISINPDDIPKEKLTKEERDEFEKKLRSAVVIPK